MKVCFKDLSVPLKVSVVFTYIVLGIYALAFITGIIIGVMEL